MDDLLVSGRSSISTARPKPKSKTLGVNFAQRRAVKSPKKEAVTISKDSKASTTYLTSPSAADKRGNPCLTTEDVLDRLSRSLPQTRDSLEDEFPVKDSIVMKPDFSARTGEQQESAAVKIQTHWRRRSEEKKQEAEKTLEKERTGEEVKLTHSLREMLAKEKEKMLAERENEAEKERKTRFETEEKKRKARLKAIEDLNKKREEKRKLQQKLVEEELKLASERTKKKKTPKKGKPTKTPEPGPEEIIPETATPVAAEPNLNTTVDNTVFGAVDNTVSGAVDNTAPGAVDNTVSRAEDQTYDNLIDEIFQSNSRKVTGPPSPKVGWEEEPSARDKKKAFSSLMDTLRMLEAESDAALSEVKSDHVSIPPTPKLTQGEVYKLDRLGAPPDLSTVMGGGKIKSILSFLETADNSAPSEDAQSYSSAAALERARLRDVSAAVEEVTENVRETQSQLSTKAEQLEMLKGELTSTTQRTAALQAQVFAAKLESDEKGKAVLMLQRALDEQRDLTLRLTTEQEKDAQQRLGNQKAEYETAIQRHLGFIDQLIADKKELSEKVEGLVSQLRATEKRLGDKVKVLEDGQKVEVKKQREAVEAAEKIKRERWIAEKSNQIKEMTVKGLEPEIQKLISKNKAEVKRLKAVHEAELLAADERASKRFVAQVEDLREQLEKEKEAACGREREYAQGRFQKQLEQEEEAFQQQRRRLYAEVQEEKDRVAESLAKHKQTLETERKTLQEEFETKSAKFQATHSVEIENLHRDHANAMRDIELRIEVEKEQWLETQKQKQTAELMARERDIRAALRQERNKEIEMVIGKLEEQAALAKEETEATVDCRMRRLKDKYESQIADLEHINNTAQSKLNVMKERLTDVEADNIRLRGGIKSLERQNEDIEKVSSRLKGERDKVEEVIREEFSERLVRLEEENKNVKTELVECRTRHKLELERVERAHEAEMGDVQGRITSAFFKRDELIRDLREKEGAAVSRADHLEALLIKQREELLKPALTRK